MLQLFYLFFVFCKFILIVIINIGIGRLNHWLNAKPYIVFFFSLNSNFYVYIYNFFSVFVERMAMFEKIIQRSCVHLVYLKIYAYTQLLERMLEFPSKSIIFLSVNDFLTFCQLFHEIQFAFVFFFLFSTFCYVVLQKEFEFVCQGTKKLKQNKSQS